MKKVLSCMVLVLMIVTILPINVLQCLLDIELEAKASVYSSDREQNDEKITHALYSKSSYDDAESFVIQDGVLLNYTGTETNVIIPDEVISIGEYAFANNENLEYVEIPDTVNSIGNGAFAGCTSLLEISIPDSVESIGSAAFSECTSLTSIRLPENDNYSIINEFSFHECQSLVNVNIPNSITEISANAFYNCKNLKDVELPKNLSKLDSCAFYNCDLITSINIPKSLVNSYTDFDNNGPFAECDGLKTVIFEEEVTIIPEGLFARCVGIENIEIPYTVTKIESYAFYQCKKLSDVNLPENLTILGYEVFYDCDMLKSINIPKNLEEVYSYTAEEINGPFAKCDDLKTIEFEEGITTIPGGLFAGCDGLEKVEIPNTVTEIGMNAFYECENLSDINLPDKLIKLGSGAFFNCDNITSINIPRSLNYSGDPFGKCDGLKTIIFGDGITTIPENLFAGCDGLEKVDIPDSVTVIESRAFYECVNLVEVNIANSVTEIGTSAFGNCKKLSDVNLPNNLTTLYSSAFYDCDNITSINIPKNLQDVGPYYVGFEANGPFGKCDGLKTIVFEEGITTIPEGLFSGCDGLEKVEMPETVTLIEQMAFYECEKLEEVLIPNSTEKIEPWVFGGCISLENLVIPVNVKEIGDRLCCDCTNLKTVTLSPNTTSIGLFAFQNCKSLKEVIIPDSVTCISNYAFQNCTSLQTVTMENGLTSIGDEAFSRCESLESITLPDSLISLGKDAFSYCDNLSLINLGAGITEIPPYCFYEDIALKNVVLPQQVTTVGEYAFSNCTEFEYITVNRNVTSIAVNAFSNPDKLTMYGVEGTYAEEFASANNIVFVPLSNPTTNIELNYTELKIDKDEKNKLIASITPVDSSDELVWTSTNENVATVSETGVVEALEVGHTTIFARAGDVIVSCDVTVYQAVSSVCIDYPSIAGTIGQIFDITATVYPTDACNKKLIWSSDNTDVAIVDEDGTVTAVGFGNAMITVTTEDGGKKDYCTVTIVPVSVTGVSLDITSLALTIGEERELVPIIEPIFATNQEVVWLSDDIAVATVNQTGCVTAVSSGTANITVTTRDGGYTANCVVTVTTETKEQPTENDSDNPPSEDEPTIPPVEQISQAIDVTYHTHIQSYGDSQGTKKNGEMAGTSGEAKRLENIWIDVEGNDNLGVQYSTHCQSYGWMPWSCDGETNGTSGEAKRLEAIKIQLTGADKDKYDIYYRVHAQSYGWLGWAKNGEPSGTAGYAKRLEGIQVVVVKKGEAAPALNYAGVDGSSSKYKNQPYVAAKQENIVIPGDVNAPIVSYKTHVQSFGWQKWVHNGAMSGTSGQAKRLEGINIKVTNCPYDGDIVYTTHVQTYGWQGKPDDATRTGWKKNGEMSGTSGEAKRLEAICIDLTGEMGEKYDIYYRVHAQSFGWLGWAKNGEESGTAGYAKRLEGIQIVLVPKGGAAPANSYGGVTSARTEAYIQK